MDEEEAVIGRHRRTDDNGSYILLPLRPGLADAMDDTAGGHSTSSMDYDVHNLLRAVVHWYSIGRRGTDWGKTSDRHLQPAHKEPIDIDCRADSCVPRFPVRFGVDMT